MGNAVIFALSLVPCAIAARCFWNAVIKDVERGILTIPFGIFLAVYFLVVPITNAISGRYVDERVFTHDPVDSLSLLNIVNTTMLLVATLGARFIRRKPLKKPMDWKPGPGFIAMLAILFTGSFVYGIYWIYLGGGFIETPSDRAKFSGSIYRYVFIESAPITFCWLVTCIALARGKQPGTLSATAIGLIQAILVVGLASSRGARVSIVSTLLFTMQIYNYSLLRVRAIHVISGGLMLLAFLQGYANYKYGGRSALEAYLSGSASSDAAAYYNDPVHFIIGDLGRADIQAPLVWRYIDGDFKPNGFGESYLSAVALLFPKEMRPEGLRPKSRIGADAQLDIAGNPSDYKGVIIDADGYLVSSRIYGLLGESVLNFGLLGAPFAFLLYGAVSRLALMRAVDLTSWDRLLVAPFFASLPIYMLFYDLDNMLVQAITIWGVPSVLLLLYRGTHVRR